ncbi:hypothetical protein [Mycobacterium sp.]|uniref:hypothetical protein n=1 Tax=Mycobacterium sp. TaxID=1785 RepID=UPI0028B5D16F|nr:hypothetical protein [Mycobacterium sp.]MDT5053854.1 hypothetical protein [Mycobacterium sp.]
MSATMASDATMSRDFDYRWQQVFALSGLVGVVLCIVAWELCFPQPPDFIFYKSGPFAPNGAGSWYLAVFTWGPWIIALSIQMSRMLAQQHKLGTEDHTGALVPG